MSGVHPPVVDRSLPVVFYGLLEKYLVEFLGNVVGNEILDGIDLEWKLRSFRRMTVSKRLAVWRTCDATSDYIRMLVGTKR